jgi:hypothetical protein
MWRAMRIILIGAGIGLLLAVALIEIPTYLASNSRTELGDSYVVMVPLGLFLGATAGAIWHSWRSR